VLEQLKINDSVMGRDSSTSAIYHPQDACDYLDMLKIVSFGWSRLVTCYEYTLTAGE
jgi:hypothetical protein